MNIICHICQNATITHYRQKRVDGVTVITARCENGHIPEKGRPFYPLALFDITALPVLPGQRDELMIVKSLPMFETQPQPERPQTLLEYVEWKRNLMNTTVSKNSKRSIQSAAK